MGRLSGAALAGASAGGGRQNNPPSLRPDPPGAAATAAVPARLHLWSLSQGALPLGMRAADSRGRG